MIPSTLPPPASGQAAPDATPRSSSSSSPDRFSPALERAQRSFDAAEPEATPPARPGLVGPSSQDETAEFESDAEDVEDVDADKDRSLAQQSIGLHGQPAAHAQPDQEDLGSRSAPTTVEASSSTTEASPAPSTVDIAMADAVTGRTGPTVDNGRSDTAADHDLAPTAGGDEGAGTDSRFTENASDEPIPPDLPSQGAVSSPAAGTSAENAAGSEQPMPQAPQPNVPQQQRRSMLVADASTTTIAPVPAAQRTATASESIDRTGPTDPAGGIGVAIDRLLGATTRVEQPTNQAAPAPRPPVETASTSVVGALPDDVAEQLWGQVERALHRVRATADGHDLRLRLRPAELGELSIRVQTSEQGVTIHLVASSPAARQALESDSNRLRAELANAGFGNSSVDVSQRDDGHQPGSSMSHNAGEQHRSGARGDGSDTGYRPTVRQEFGRVRRGSSVNLTL